jgi:hypothetical protein
MNIHEALRKIDWRKATYFRWKHQIKNGANEHILKMDEDELLRYTQRKHIDFFKKWEDSQEYQELLMLYLSGKINKDFEEIYSIVTEKAKQGDEKSVRLFLQMQKDIMSYGKALNRTKAKQEQVEEDDDDLEI